MTNRYLIAVVFLCIGAASVLFYQRIVPRTAADVSSMRGPSSSGDFHGDARFTGGFGLQPLLVETTQVIRADVAEELSVVGNLVGATTVEVAPKINGRLRRLDLRLGDRVIRGQEIARVEDDELQQQVNQAEASFEVSRATVRQQEANLLLAGTNRERAKSLMKRSLLSQQELDDEEARFQAATAQFDLVRAQFDQAKARLQELRINLANTVMVSPVNGFIGRRYLDPGAYVTQSTAVVSVVDISLVRLVANLVERDLRRVFEGTRTRVEVDAYPKESFVGQVARIAPVLDPATRTAEIEIEIPNQDLRLKPGMYARVRLSVGNKLQALVVPREAIVMRNSARGVFIADIEGEQMVARFTSLAIGFEDDRYVEVTDGVFEGDTVVTTGSAGLQHGDPILIKSNGTDLGVPKEGLS